VLVSLRAVTAGIAAPAGTCPEAAPDERELFLQQALDLFVVLFGSLEEALAQTAGSFGHGASIRLCWHTVKH
jgi:hypothetical protein